MTKKPVAATIPDTFGTWSEAADRHRPLADPDPAQHPDQQDDGSRTRLYGAICRRGGEDILDHVALINVAVKWK